MPTRSWPKVGAVEIPVPPTLTASVEEEIRAVPLKYTGAPVVKTPVVELYARGYVAESDVEEILLLKVVKSVAERYPLTAVVA